MSTSEQQASDLELPGNATLIARGLTKIYKTGTVEIRALDGVDLELYDSELVDLPLPEAPTRTTSSES